MTSQFGAPESWPEDDLIGLSRDFDAELVLDAYRHGVFPMPTEGYMGWYSPLDRGVLPLGGLKVSRSLAKMTHRYEVRVDTAFDEVVDGCADRRRPHGWITRDIRRVYRALYEAGHVHSVEAWTPEGVLAGGLYGVSVGGLFAGESMFHRADIGRDASKVALIGLVELLASGGTDGRLLDVQWRTDHLASLGVVEISRPAYLRRLVAAVTLDPPPWPQRPSK